MASPEAEQEKRPLTGNEMQQRQLAPVTHGAFRFILTGLWPICKKCILAAECPEYEPESTSCGLFSGIQEERTRELMKEPQIRPTDAPLVVLFAKEETFVTLADAWVSKIGVFRIQDAGLDVQPILTRRAAAVHTMIKLSDRLGFNPVSRKLLAFDPNRAPKDAKEIISYLELKKRTREAARRSGHDGDGSESIA